MNMLRRLYVSFLLSISFILNILYAGDIDLTMLNWDQMYAGNVVVESVENRNEVPGIQLLFIVAAPRDSIWHTLTDYSNFPYIFKGTQSVTVKNKDSSGAEVEIKYSKKIVGVFKVSYTYTLRRDYIIPGAYLTWQRVSGDFNVIEGYWKIISTDRPDTFLLIYESYLDGGWFFPTKFIRKMAKKEAVAMAQHVRQWMEAKTR